MTLLLKTVQCELDYLNIGTYMSSPGQARLHMMTTMTTRITSTADDVYDEDNNNVMQTM